jgi:hypothetical protein
VRHIFTSSLKIRYVLKKICESQAYFEKKNQGGATAHIPELLVSLSSLIDSSCK